MNIPRELAESHQDWQLYPLNLVQLGISNNAAMRHYLRLIDPDSTLFVGPSSERIMVCFHDFEDGRSGCDKRQVSNEIQLDGFLED